ncbi:MAG: hypothetical protein NTV30_07645 [Chloroflexi bacterium]|nr:hypothetical protein [Chloroflexota bacterium]
MQRKRLYLIKIVTDKPIKMKTNSTRRTFFQTAVLGTAALTTGISKASALEFNPGKTTMPPLKLGLMTYNLGKDWDIDTIIKNCTETGWVHAELRTTHKHGVEVTLSKQERAEVKKRFKDSSMEAISLASAFAYHFTDQAELRKNIEGTKEYLQLAPKKKPWNKSAKRWPKWVNSGITLGWMSGFVCMETVQIPFL